MAAQGEVGAQPRVEVLHQGTAARGVRHGPAYGVEERVELASSLRAQPVPPLPVSGRGAGRAVQHASFPHQGLGDGMGLRDVGQFLIEHAGEGEHGVALVLQRDPHRADAPRVLGLAGCEFLDDEVEQHLSRRQGRSGQRQNVMAQPLGERSDVAGQPMRLGLGLPRKRQLGGKPVAGRTLAGAADPGLQRLAPGRGALGEARQRVGEALALALDVEHVAMARRVAPGGPLPGAQALPGIGDRVVRIEPLLGGVQQVHAPGVGVAVALRRQQVAIRRRGIDACQHGRGTLEDLVMQAHPNAGQLLVVVDRARLPCRRPEHVVDAAQAHGHAQQVAQELDDAAIRAAADQRQPDDHLTQPGPGHRQLEQHLVVRRGRRESIIQRRLGSVRLLVDELAAHPVPGGEAADRLRSRQRLKGQVLAVALRQPRRCANTSVHARTTPESVRVPSSVLPAPTQLHL